MALKIPGTKLQQNGIEAIFMLQVKLLAMEHLASVFHIMDEFNFTDDNKVDKIFVKSVNMLIQQKAQSLKSYFFLTKRTSVEHTQKILEESIDQVFEKINSLLHVDAVKTGDFFLSSITNNFVDIHNLPNREDGFRQGSSGLLNSIHNLGSEQEFRKFFMEKYFSAKNSDGEDVLYSVPEFESAYMATVQTSGLTSFSSVEYFHLKEVLKQQQHPAFAGVVIDPYLVSLDYFKEKTIEEVIDDGTYPIATAPGSPYTVLWVVFPSDVENRIASLEIAHPMFSDVLLQFEELDLNEVRAGVRLMYLPEQKKAPAGAAPILQEQSITKNSFAYSVKEIVGGDPVYFHPIEICKVESPFQLAIDGELQGILDEVGLTKDEFEFAEKIFGDLTTFSDATFGEIRKHYELCLDGLTDYQFDGRYEYKYQGENYASVLNIGGGQDFLGWTLPDADTGDTFVVTSFQEKQKIYDEFFGKLVDIQKDYIEGNVEYPHTKTIMVLDKDNFERKLSYVFIRTPLEDTLEFYNKVVENSHSQISSLLSMVEASIDPENPDKETETQKWLASQSTWLHKADGTGLWDVRPTLDQFKSNYLSNNDYYNAILWNKNLKTYLGGQIFDAYFANGYNQSDDGYGLLHCTLPPNIPKPSGGGGGAVAGSGKNKRDRIDGSFFPFLVASTSGFSNLSGYNQTKLGFYKSSFFQYEWMWDRILTSTKTYLNYSERLNALIENHNMLVETRDQQAHITEILDKLKQVKAKIGYSTDLFPKEFSKMAKTIKDVTEYKKVFKHILPTQALNVLLPIYFMKQSSQIRSLIKKSKMFEDINEGLEYVARFYNNPNEFYLEGEKE